MSLSGKRTNGTLQPDDVAGGVPIGRSPIQEPLPGPTLLGC
jgi:hypothetical protein